MMGMEDRSLRVLHVIHQYPPEQVGGSELVTQRVTRALASRGVTVAVFTRQSAPGRGLSRSEEEGVTVYRAVDGAPSAGERYLAGFGRGPILAAFDQVLTEFAPDLVHIQHLMGLPLAILDRLHSAELPTVVTLHDYWWVCANAQLLTNYDAGICAGPRAYLNCTRCAVARGGPALWPAAPVLWASLGWRGRRLRQGLHAADLLVTPTHFTAAWHTSHGAPQERMRVRPWGVDLPPVQRTRRTELPLHFAVIGGLAWQKGVHVAIDAATQMADSVRLTVAGVGDDAAYVADLQRRAGSNVTLVGRVDRAAVAALLAEVDAVLVPSLWYESYSLALHEAWAAGVPVLASDLGVMAHTITHDVDGLLLAPGDVAAWAAAFTRLAAAPQELTRLAHGIQPPPSVDSHIDTLLQDYAEVLTARTGMRAPG